MHGNFPAQRNISSLTRRKFFLVHVCPPKSFSQQNPALALTSFIRSTASSRNLEIVLLPSSSLARRSRRSALAKPLWVGVGGVELVARFLKLNRAGFRVCVSCCNKT